MPGCPEACYRLGEWELRCFADNNRGKWGEKIRRIPAISLAGIPEIEGEADRLCWELTGNGAPEGNRAWCGTCEKR